MEFQKLPIVLSCLIVAMTLMSTFTCATRAGYSFLPNLPQEYLDAHNPSRAELGLTPLVWNDTLAVYAQGYAAQRAGDCALQHSHGPYGENIAEGSWNLSPKEAVGLWVGEKSSYDYGSNSCVGGKQCGHYTQVVWRDTRSVGCGKVPCMNGWTFVTCNYYPPGNYIGERPY